MREPNSGNLSLLLAHDRFGNPRPGSEFVEIAHWRRISARKSPVRRRDHGTLAGAGCCRKAGTTGPEPGSFAGAGSCPESGKRGPLVRSLALLLAQVLVRMMEATGPGNWHSCWGRLLPGKWKAGTIVRSLALLLAQVLVRMMEATCPESGSYFPEPALLPAGQILCQGQA